MGKYLNVHVYSSVGLSSLALLFANYAILPINHVMPVNIMYNPVIIMFLQTMNDKHGTSTKVKYHQQSYPSGKDCPVNKGCTTVYKSVLH